MMFVSTDSLAGWIRASFRVVGMSVLACAGSSGITVCDALVTGPRLFIEAVQ